MCGVIPNLGVSYHGITSVEIGAKIKNITWLVRWTLLSHGFLALWYEKKLTNLFICTSVKPFNFLFARCCCWRNTLPVEILSLHVVVQLPQTGAKPPWLPAKVMTEIWLRLETLTYSCKHKSLPEHKEHSGWPLGLTVLSGKSFSLHEIFPIQTAAGVVIKANIFRHFTLHVQALRGAHSILFSHVSVIRSVRNQPELPCCAYEHSLTVAWIGTLNVGTYCRKPSWTLSAFCVVLFSAFLAHILSKIKMTWCEITRQKQRRASVSKHLQVNLISGFKSFIEAPEVVKHWNSWLKKKKCNYSSNKSSGKTWSKA